MLVLVLKAFVLKLSYKVYSNLKIYRVTTKKRKFNRLGYVTRQC